MCKVCVRSWRGTNLLLRRRGCPHHLSLAAGDDLGGGRAGASVRGRYHLAAGDNLDRAPGGHHNLLWLLLLLWL